MSFTYTEEKNNIERFTRFTQTALQRIAAVRSIDTTSEGLFSTVRLSRAPVGSLEEEGGEILWSAMADLVVQARIDHVKQEFIKDAPVSRMAEGDEPEDSGNFYRGPRSANIGPGPYFRSTSEVYNRGDGVMVSRYPKVRWRDGFDTVHMGQTVSRSGERSVRSDKTRGPAAPVRGSMASVVNYAPHAHRLIHGSPAGRGPKHPQDIFPDSDRKFWMVFIGKEGNMVFIPTPAEILRRQAKFQAKEALRKRKKRRGSKPHPVFDTRKAYITYKAVSRNQKIAATIARVASEAATFYPEVEKLIDKEFNRQFTILWQEAHE